VLQPFTTQEEAFILPAVERAANAVEVILLEGMEKAMAFFHTADGEEKN
jgi:peptidyl-tRNA hydrolase